MLNFVEETLWIVYSQKLMTAKWFCRVGFVFVKKRVFNKLDAFILDIF